MIYKLCAISVFNVKMWSDIYIIFYEVFVCKLEFVPLKYVPANISLMLLMLVIVVIFRRIMYALVIVCTLNI